MRTQFCALAFLQALALSQGFFGSAQCLQRAAYAAAEARGPGLTNSGNRVIQNPLPTRSGIPFGRNQTHLKARSNAPEVTDDTWEDMVLGSKGNLLMFYSAPWCGPCRLMCQVINEVMELCGDRLRVGEISTDENPKCVAESQVRSIPTLKLFVDGKCVMTVVGAIPKNSLLNSLSKHIELPTSDS